MVDRVKQWIAEGRDVRIFTARVHPEPEAFGADYRTMRALAAIETWCAQHLGVKLPVTCMKDRHMRELWDDRAVQVEKNTGRRIGDHQR